MCLSLGTVPFVYPRMSLSLEQLDFDLDPALIARQPAQPREAARLMVVHLGSSLIEHRRIQDLSVYLHSGDRLVLNSTHVMPARFDAIRSDTGGHLEGLLLDRVGPRSWWARIRKSRRLRPRHLLTLLHSDGTPSPYTLRVNDTHDGRILVELLGDDSVDNVLRAVGNVPLPPYIRAARRDHDEPIADPRDAAWYQTVYADRDGPTHSAAAPTAGLHLSDELLESLDAKGVERIDVSLEVGEGTFKPVEVETLSEHQMHFERCVVTEAAIQSLRRPCSGRTIAVGTTVVRTLESLPTPLPSRGGLDFSTDLLIEPGYDFRFINGLLTNFHLPRSTLLALVGALTGIDRLHELYAEAIAHQYRFFSYGDAMLLLGGEAP